MSEVGAIWDEVDAKLDITLVETNQTKEEDAKSFKSFNGSESDVRKQLSAKHRYTFCSTIGEQRKCPVGSITCLADDRIILSDFLWSKLKVFDKDYNFSFAESCTQRAVITHYTGNEIALTSRDLKRVEFYAVEKNRIVELSKKFELKHKAYGLEYGNNHFALLLLSNAFYIGILTEDGIEKYAIPTQLMGTKPLTLSKFYCMDPSEDKLYISDQFNKKVVCVKYTGDVIFQVTMSSYIPCGLILLERVIVVAVSNSYIVAIIPAGDIYTTHSLITKKEHVVNPSQLSLQHKSRCVLVANLTGEYRDIIKAFNITWSES